MHKTFYCCLLLVYSSTCLCEDVILNKTQLIFGFMAHRHGDRAPLPSAIQYISDKEKAMAISNKYGYGQLTNGGRRRGYELGKFIRRRYGSLLSQQYNRSEIYLRSTDSTRTKMTMLTAMAAVYPPTKDNWSKDIKWTPAPYTTYPARYDDMYAILNCPNFRNECLKRGQIHVPELDKYDGVLNELSKILGVNITRNYYTVLTINNAFTSQMSLGIPFDPKIKKLIPEIKKAADEAIEYMFGDTTYASLALQSGVLLRDFFVEVDKILKGDNVPRIRVYSGHDITVYPLARISKSTPNIGVPFYCSLFALELRKVVETGRYIVVVDKILKGDNVPRIRVYSGHDITVYPLARISKSTPNIGVPFYCSLFALELRKVVETGRYIVVVDKILKGDHVPRIRVYSGHDITVYPLARISKSTPNLGVPFYCSLFALELRKVVETGQYIVVVDKILKGDHVPRIRVYSGHDITVYPLARISKSTPNLGVPFYYSLFALELRKVVETGRYIVVPVYLKNPSAKEQYLQIDGCGEPCDLQQYRKLTSKFLLDVYQLRAQCGYTEDLVIDTSSID